MRSGPKLKTLDELLVLRAGWAARGQRVVWTNGCFDILHAGHVRSFRDAKSLGDVLVVGINSDASVRANKGNHRPIVGEDGRAEVVAALEAVDYVTVFNETDPVRILSLLKPDVHCKGAEYADGSRPVPERETVLSYGGEVRFLPFHPGPFDDLIRANSARRHRVSYTIAGFLEKAASLQVLVVGDCMLDAYVIGAASRISPEAPVPVVSVGRRRYVAGGAGNVAANIRAMGSSVFLAGVTGVDESAVRLRLELERHGIATDALIEDASRPTTTKTRITAAGQQIVRFDDEDVSALSAVAFAQLRERCEALLNTVGVCVISDYAKGVVSDELCRWLIGEAARRGVPVVVDPKSRDLARYRGASVITPNLKEAAAAAGEPIESSADLARAAERLLVNIAPSALLVTRGEDGMSLFESGMPERHLPAVVNEVADVTGAGDTVAGALAIALGTGFDLPAAMAIANIAAGVAVSHSGTWAVTRAELLEASVAETATC